MEIAFYTIFIQNMTENLIPLNQFGFNFGKIHVFYLNDFKG